MGAFDSLERVSSMCGRYYVDDDMAKEIEKLVREVEAGLKLKKAGDVCPSQDAAVISGKMHELAAKVMKWGFPQYKGSGLLINARAETVLDRRMFRESALHCRCVIPARRFYEWDKEKNKVTFQQEDQKVIFMAGFYNRFEGQDRFVILTTQANSSVSGVHDRMPLLLGEKELEDWVFDDKYLEAALKKVPQKLIKSQEYEQQSLFPFMG